MSCISNRRYHLALLFRGQPKFKNRCILDWGVIGSMFWWGSTPSLRGRGRFASEFLPKNSSGQGFGWWSATLVLIIKKSKKKFKLATKAMQFKIFRIFSFKPALMAYYLILYSDYFFEYWAYHTDIICWFFEDLFH